MPMARTETDLFVYGTLRHDQPEHARFCRGLTGWQPARARGRLFRLVEGYLLMVIQPAAILRGATGDAAADERRRRELVPEDLERAVNALEQAGESWISGEVLAFTDAGRTWPPLDRWEGVTPGRDSVYLRVVVPVQTDDPLHPWRPAWIYAATRAPAGAVEVSAAPPG